MIAAHAPGQVTNAHFDTLRPAPARPARNVVDSPAAANAGDWSSDATLTLPDS